MANRLLDFSNEDIRIHLATEEHLQKIVQVDELVIGHQERIEYISNSIRQELCFVALVESMVVGFIIFDRSFYDQFFISLLIVHPGFRRKNIGSKLLQEIEDHCLPQKLFTSTNQSNKGMQRLLEGRGYIQSGYIENLDEGDPEIVYYKSTSGSLNVQQKALKKKQAIKRQLYTGIICFPILIVLQSLQLIHSPSVLLKNLHLISVIALAISLGAFIRELFIQKANEREKFKGVSDPS